MTCAHAAQANLLLDGLQNVLKMVCRRFSKKVLPQLMGLQMKIFVFPVPDVNRSNTSPPNSVPDILFIFWKTSLVGPPYQQIFDCEPEQINPSVLMLSATRNSDTSKFARHMILLASLLSCLIGGVSYLTMPV